MGRMPPSPEGHKARRVAPEHSQQVMPPDGHACLLIERNAMNVSFDFSGHVALVTGAASGMGLATAKAFAQAGASVVLADVDEVALAAATAEIAALGMGATKFIRCDVSNEDDVAGMVDFTVNSFGRLDAAFNNAGIQIPAVDIADLKSSDFDRVQAINTRGVWLCMKHELRHMRERGTGAIVNCSSIGGLIGTSIRLAAYHGTKHAVLGITRSAALEYGQRGIRINAVCPGTISTPMVNRMIADGILSEDGVAHGSPMGRPGRPEEIADAVLWLCSDGATYVTGHALSVDGGMAVA